MRALQEPNRPAVRVYHANRVLFLPHPPFHSPLPPTRQATAQKANRSYQVTRPFPSSIKTLTFPPAFAGSSYLLGTAEPQPVARPNYSQVLANAFFSVLPLSAGKASPVRLSSGCDSALKRQLRYCFGKWVASPGWYLGKSLEDGEIENPRLTTVAPISCHVHVCLLATVKSYASNLETRKATDRDKAASGVEGACEKKKESTAFHKGEDGARRSLRELPVLRF